MLGQLISTLNDYLYTYILVILLLAAGVYFTIRTGFIQFWMFGESIRVVGEKPHNAGSISSFQALMVSTASRVGTGNIIGISTAICCGGYGAVFWMWLLALIGAASAFIESTLAQCYKEKHGDNWVGGPAYYIQKALGSRFFAWCSRCCSSLLRLRLQRPPPTTPAPPSSTTCPAIPRASGPRWWARCWPCSPACASSGGVRRISAITSGIVPVMAAIYIALGLFITVKNIGQVPYMLSMIVSQAFDPKAMFAGIGASCIMQGIKRGPLLQ